MSNVLTRNARPVNAPIQNAWHDKGLNDSSQELALGLCDNAR
ncbi:hypothetical protein PMI26_01234 [Pseudomonas sp. GM33]|jgi:hypothetical protein|nr:hypothetical protein PMI26_01234 [Pseudomonas sp. GM33]MDP9652248.1 hypothetical protein [Pseudomonas putida]